MGQKTSLRAAIPILGLQNPILGCRTALRAAKLVFGL